MPDLPPSDCSPEGPADAGQVLRLADYDTGHPGRVLTGLRQHWQGLRAGRVVPDRMDITATGLGPALNHTFILERIAPGAARLRLAGRHLIDLMGMEVRGMPLSAFFNPPSRGRLSDVLESVFQAPQLADLMLFSPAAHGNPPLAARLMLLPLKSDLGDVTRALGCLIAEGSIGRAPRRFDLAHEKLDPVIEGAQVVEPGAPGRPRLRAELQRRDAAMRAGQQPRQSSDEKHGTRQPLSQPPCDAKPPQAATGAGWLRLVVNND